MKYRLLDLVKAPGDGSRLSVRNATVRQVPFNVPLTEVKCQTHCGLKNRPVIEAKVTPDDCRTCFSQEIVAGELVSESGGVYPVVGGIPRLLSTESAEWVRKNQSSFSLEWKMFRFGERNWGQDIQYRKNLFLTGVGKTAGDLRRKIIFDAGCGSGALSIALADSFEMEVVAVDLAFGIERAYAHNTNPFVYFIQGSVLEPPVRDASVDLLYCAGVLVHIPDARAGFSALMPTLKPGGRYIVWMYHLIDRVHHPNDLVKMSIYNWIRTNVTSRLPIQLQYGLYLSLIPFYLVKQQLSNLVRVEKNQTTWREKVQDLTDMFSPLYQHRFDEAEIVEWFKKAGFENATTAYQEQYGFATRADLPATTYASQDLVAQATGRRA
jgi:ubiquinone/menaquinone biosynthesis C-methylase UbiE/uncharacterized protein YbaR (Trm112 family)